MRETCTSGSTRGRRVADYSVAHRPTLPAQPFPCRSSAHGRRILGPRM